MKKFRFLAIAMATMLTLGMVSCGPKDEDVPYEGITLNNGEFIEIVKIIDAFAFIPSVAMILLEENMVNQSYYNASTRYEYLSLANRIGLLGQLGLKSFDEV